MGAKNCPESARQKMINMMYLVLTAMLALNVAAETLQAFKVVDASLMKTYLSFTDKNKSLIRDFNSQYEINQDKVEKWRNLAVEVHNSSDSLINFIIESKVKLAEAAGANIKEPDAELGKEFPYIISTKNDTLILETQDDLNASPQVMLTGERGKLLQQKVQQYRDELIGIVADYPHIIENLNSSLDVDDPEKRENKMDKSSSMNFRTWAQQNFEATPVIAAITILSKLQIDVRNAESAVLRHLFNQIDAKSIKVTGLKATVIPDATYIFEGQQYRARIFLSAEDSTQQLEVFVDKSAKALPIEGNEAIYTFTPSQAGIYSHKGEIKFINPDGGNGTKPFEFEFQVAKPAVTIAPTKMNVLFMSLKNPISVSVPGVPSDKVEAICNNGKMYREGDNWMIEPAEVDYRAEKTKVTVFADFNGQKRQMGEMTYRVMKVPNPIAMVAQKSEGQVSRDILRIQTMISAEMQDFYFDLRFNITSFDVSVNKGGLTTTLSSNSYAFTPDQKRLLSSLGGGDKVIFENIKARIEDNKDDPERPLSPVILTVQ